jgi:SAM-dependent methyltransferase
MLDVGAGEVDRYGKYFTTTEVIRMDVNHGDYVDVVGSADNIPFADNTFDSVLCTQVFEHLKDPFKSAKEIYRVLKIDGKLLMTVPQTNELHEEPHDFFRYTKYGLKSLFKDAGFEIVEFDQRGGYYSNLSQIKIRRMIDLFNLYERPIIGRIFGKFIGIYGKSMIWLDKVDKSKSNKKHAIGWCFVLQKNK